MRISNGLGRYLVKLLFLIVIAASVKAQSRSFTIDVAVNYLEIDLEHIFGGDYSAWWVVDIGPGDTASMEYSEIVRFVNGCNVAVDILSSVRDDPDSTSPDTLWLPWTAATHPAADSFEFHWASYPSPPTSPALVDSRTILSTPGIVESDVPSGANRYLHAWLMVPTDGVRGERHRLSSRIIVTPSVTP